MRRLYILGLLVALLVVVASSCTHQPRTLSGEYIWLGYRERANVAHRRDIDIYRCMSGYLYCNGRGGHYTCQCIPE